MLIVYHNYATAAPAMLNGELRVDKYGGLVGKFPPTRVFTVFDDSSHPPRVVQLGCPDALTCGWLRACLPETFIDLHGNIRRGSDNAIIFAAPDIINQES